MTVSTPILPACPLNIGTRMRPNALRGKSSGHSRPPANARCVGPFDHALKSRKSHRNVFSCVCSLTPQSASKDPLRAKLIVSPSSVLSTRFLPTRFACLAEKRKRMQGGGRHAKRTRATRNREGQRIEKPRRRRGSLERKAQEEHGRSRMRGEEVARTAIVQRAVPIWHLNARGRVPAK